MRSKEVALLVHQATQDDGAVPPAVPGLLDAYVIAEDPRYLDIARRFEGAFNSCPNEANGRQSCKTLRKGDNVFIEIVTTFKLVVKDKTGT